MRNLLGTLPLLIGLWSPPLHATPLEDLNNAFQNSQWDDTIQIGQDILTHDSSSSEARLKMAYALFQKGYPDAALLILKGLKASDWKSLPQGKDRLVEVVSLFRKKVPLNFLPWSLEDISEGETSPYLVNELRYLKGKDAYDRHDSATAQKFLGKVTKNSRYYVQARYLLGSLAAEAGDYKTAAQEFSEVFQPSVLDQSAEFWHDVSAQVSSHWGANFRIQYDAQLLAETQVVAELALLALARIAYGKKDFQAAINSYSKIQKNSPLHDEVIIEESWTYLAMEQHDKAQKEAESLTTTGTSFNALKARVLRALILTEMQKTDQARADLDTFSNTYQKARDMLVDYKHEPMGSFLPDFLKNDIDSDRRIHDISEHEKNLSAEIKALRKEGAGLFPVYGRLAGELELWTNQSKSFVQNMVLQHVDQRIANLDQLHVQSKLILAETYLEDREVLRKTSADHPPQDEKGQRAHDEKLVQLLQKSVDVVNELLQNPGENRAKLQFRQAELLWELGTAKIILSQSGSKIQNQAQDRKGEADRIRAVEMIKKLATDATGFQKNEQVLFFLGLAQIELGNSVQGEAVLRRYVAQYPRDQHVPDAYRILGDIHFDANRFVAAEADYKKILAFPDSSAVGYALYKLGWCAYNEREFARALLGLEKAFLWATESRNADSHLLGLQREARRDLVSIYAEVGDHRKALEYFQRFSDKAGIDWLLDLIAQLNENGQFEKVQDLYRTLIRLDPAGPDNVIYEAGMIEAAYKLQRWNVVADELARLASVSGPLLEMPQASGHKNFQVEKTLHEVVTAHLTDYKNTGDASIVGRVINLDQIYLSMFKKWPQSQSLLYRHAQFLLDHDRIGDAAEAFRQHWSSFATILKEPLREEALRNVIHTLNKIEDAKKVAKPDGKVLPPEAQELISYSKEYEKNYPSSQYLRPILFVRSTLYLKYGMLEEGIVESQKILDKNSADDFGKRSFKNLAKAHYDLKDWKRTYDWASGLKVFPDEVKTIRQESYFLWADTTADTIESAHLFQKIASDPSMAALHDKSLFNAFVRLQKAGKKFEALQAADALDKKFSNYDGLSQIAGIRAAYYQEAGDYNRAMPLLENFLKSGRKDIPSETLEQARLNAAFISEAQGQFEKAKKYYRSYLNEGAPTETGKRESEKGLKRLAEKLAPQAKPYFKDWVFLLKEKSNFEKRPLPPTRDLVIGLKAGAGKLAKVTKTFLDVATSPKTPPSFSLEAYCVLPSLYERYSGAVRELSKGDKDVATELEKVAQPIEAKGKEFAQGCLDRAASQNHDGTMYRSVLETWGWAKDKNLKNKITALLETLKKNAPWIEPIDLNTTEEALIKAHLSDTQTQAADAAYLSWLQLARLRFEKKEYGISRLTYIDALTRFPQSSALKNGYACTELAYNSNQNLSELFEKAGESGSAYAWVNLAILHLEKGRLEPAQAALKKALSTGAFDKFADIKMAVQEVIPK